MINTLYTEEMLASMKKVEETRSQRLKEEFPRLDAREKQDILEQYHPDYRSDSMRAIKVGPNAGDRMPHELVDLLEARPAVSSEDMDLSQVDMDVDVLVIGGGGAGMAAALTAQAAGAEVAVVTKLRLGDANTVMAQGGIQAASKENDSPATHYLDVMGGGGYQNIPELVRALVSDAPGVISWLEELGCMLNKEEDGTLVTIHGGGTSRKRMHFARDYTGAEIMRVLRDEARNREVNVIEFAPVVELILDDQGQCAGAVIRNYETDEYQVIRARTVIMATGGFGRLHVQGFPTSNHYGATADGLIMAYRAGAPLVYLDATQFHPTGAAYPEQIVGLLITEKVRGVGAQLVNSEGQQFINPLETRDTVSSAILRECDQSQGVGTPTGRVAVWLDSPMIEEIHGPGTILDQLPAMHRQYQRFGIDMSKVPILTYPTLHYQNGGIEISEDGESRVSNLFVAGEAAGGIHGRNRLMGNSLLDILVFGRRAGQAAAARARETQPGSLTLDHVDAFVGQMEKEGVDTGNVSPLLLPRYARKPGQEPVTF